MYGLYEFTVMSFG
jgi:hypothetical protein